MEHTPFESELWQLLSKQYSLPSDTKATRLGGSRNRTYQIVLPDKTRYVLRFYAAGRDRAAIDAELKTLEFLDEATDIVVPRPIPNSDGTLVLIVDHPSLGEASYATMFSYVYGNELTHPHISQMLNIGRFLGKLDIALQEVDKQIKPNPSISRLQWNIGSKIEWPLSKLEEQVTNFHFLRDKARNLRGQIREVSDQLRAVYIDLEPILPHQLIHSDAHLGNIRHLGGTYAILDFDNLGFGFRVSELIPVLSSTCKIEFYPSSTSHFESLEIFVQALMQGYSEYIPISETEVDSLPFIHALWLFGFMGWAVSGRDPSLAEWIQLHGATVVERLVALLELYEQRLKG